MKPISFYCRLKKTIPKTRNFQVLTIKNINLIGNHKLHITLLCLE